MQASNHGSFSYMKSVTRFGYFLKGIVTNFVTEVAKKVRPMRFRILSVAKLSFEKLFCG